MGDVHTFTRPQAVAGLAALVHTPEVNQSEGAGPPHWGAISVSLEGRSSRSDLLLFPFHTIRVNNSRDVFCLSQRPSILPR